MQNYFKVAIYVIVITCFSTAYANSYVDFFRAVNVDNAGKVKELLARGFDPNTLSESGQVALHVAMQEDCPNVAEVLLASPALKIDAANALGETALMMAATEWPAGLGQEVAGPWRAGTQARLVTGSLRCGRAEYRVAGLAPEPRR